LKTKKEEEGKMAKRLRILLGPDGSVKVEAEGFKGEGCLAAAKPLEDLFGKADRVELKAEYYETEELINNIGLPEGHCG